MNTNEGYYGVTRTDEYLAHYGIKGMKWGVRKAIESGNSARLGRQYRKAQKKLAKLEARAANGKKYAKRAAALGAGAAVAGGLAAAGTSKIASAIGQGGMRAATAANRLGGAMVVAGGSKRFRSGKYGKIGAAMRTAGHNLQGTTAGIRVGAGQVAGRINKWGSSSNKLYDNLSGKTALLKKGNDLISQGSSKAMRNTLKGAAKRTAGFEALEKANKIKSVSNNSIARIGAGAVGVGLGAGAAYNAYRAATTKRAAKKAAQFRSEMNKAFAGTQYGKKPRQGKRRRG